MGSQYLYKPEHREIEVGHIFRRFYVIYDKWRELYVGCSYPYRRDPLHAKKFWNESEAKMGKQDLIGALGEWRYDVVMVPNIELDH